MNSPGITYTPPTHKQLHMSYGAHGIYNTSTEHLLGLLRSVTSVRVHLSPSSILARGYRTYAISLSKV